jgi:preprotein translocase subunit YajC
MNEVLAQSLASIIAYLGATPILLFLTVMGLGPWVMIIYISRQQDKRMSKMIAMYENNVTLVKSYEGLTASVIKINDNLQDLVILTTSTMQTLVEHIKSNLFCPLVKQSTQPGKIEGASRQ